MSYDMILISYDTYEYKYEYDTYSMNIIQYVPSYDAIYLPSHGTKVPKVPG